MKFAYADPPYMGQAVRHYRKVNRRAQEVNHRVLIGFMNDEFPDGWALSCSSPSLRTILPLCPAGGRVLSWVKPWAVFKPGVRVAYAWEPVILFGGRKRRAGASTVRDWVSANATMRRGMPGAKPAAFCRWLFDVLGMEEGDDLIDLFPGSGAVTEAWRTRRGEPETLVLQGTLER